MRRVLATMRFAPRSSHFCWPTKLSPPAVCNRHHWVRATTPPSLLWMSAAHLRKVRMAQILAFKADGSDQRKLVEESDEIAAVSLQPFLRPFVGNRVLLNQGIQRIQEFALPGLVVNLVPILP
jgi:hypothetical protein